MSVEETQQDPKTKMSLKTGKKIKNDETLSPRAVFDTPVSGSSFDSDISNSSPFGTPTYDKHGLQWKSLIENVKRKSVRRLSTIPLLTLYDHSTRIRRKKFGRNQSAEDPIDCGDNLFPKPTWRNFTRAELAAATNNFSNEKLMGKGGHAEVYKGHLANGAIVAVKRINKNENNKGREDRVGDFLTELGIIAHINHPNAAKLVGFSVDGGFHLVLEFSPHGSLASLLHGGSECVDWKIRFKVALGVAKGLKYLHNQCHRRIIHRDITASNVLLTQDYEPQISDFGLAKWLPEKWTHHIVHPVEGTFGYMAPEYFMHGIVDEKTDVFAFGVLLLELITGRRAVDSYRQSLVMWAKPLLEKSNVKDIADPRLGDAYDSVQMKRAMATALGCLHHSSSTRPTMTLVTKMLKGEGGWQMDMKQKSMGGRAIILDTCDLEDYTCNTYTNDLSRHMQLILE